jgi:hypothetical protein
LGLGDLWKQGNREENKQDEELKNPHRIGEKLPHSIHSPSSALLLPKNRVQPNKQRIKQHHNHRPDEAAVIGFKITVVIFCFHEEDDGKHDDCEGLPF